VELGKEPGHDCQFAEQTKAPKEQKKTACVSSTNHPIFGAHDLASTIARSPAGERSEPLAGAKSPQSAAELMLYGVMWQ